MNKYLYKSKVKRMKGYKDTHDLKFAYYMALIQSQPEYEDDPLGFDFTFLKMVREGKNPKCCYRWLDNDETYFVEFMITDITPDKDGKFICDGIEYQILYDKTTVRDFYKGMEV